MKHDYFFSENVLQIATEIFKNEDGGTSVHEKKNPEIILANQNCQKDEKTESLLIGMVPSTGRSSHFENSTNFKILKEPLLKC